MTFWLAIFYPLGYLKANKKRCKEEFFVFSMVWSRHQQKLNTIEPDPKEIRILFQKFHKNKLHVFLSVLQD